MEYEELLARAPAQDTDEFLDFLKANNEVITDGQYWLIIANCKYDTKEKRWFTAFSKSRFSDVIPPMSVEFESYRDWQWLKKARQKQSVPGRFHVHLTP